MERNTPPSHWNCPHCSASNRANDEICKCGFSFASPEVCSAIDRLSTVFGRKFETFIKAASAIYVNPIRNFLREVGAVPFPEHLNRLGHELHEQFESVIQTGVQERLWSRVSATEGLARMIAASRLGRGDANAILLGDRCFMVPHWNYQMKWIMEHINPPATAPKDATATPPRESPPLSPVSPSARAHFHPVCFLMPWTWLPVLTSALRISVTGVVIDSGVFSRRHISVPLRQVETFDIHRPIIGRLLGYGSVSVSTGGQSFLFTHVSRPRELQDVFNQARQASR